MTSKRVLTRAFTSELYVTVLVAIVLGAALGLLFPTQGAALQPLGDGWISLIRMLVGPVVFCTIVTGIASAGALTGVGRVGVKALVYFEIVTTIALVMGLVVMDVLRPGAGVHAHPGALKLTGNASLYVSQGVHEHWYDFLVNIIPVSVVSAFTGTNVLQVLLVALLFAIALRGLGERGAPIATGVERIGEVVFGMVRVVMYTAPIGAFAAMAYTTGKFGIKTLTSLGAFIGYFWATGLVFCVVVLGTVARMCGVSILRLYRYFKDELLITLGTSNYEAVMPRLIDKLERLGCPRPIVGLVVPSGYAFNSDGVCLYMGFAALYIAQAFDLHLSVWQQIGLLAVALITSKGGAGVAGAGFVLLAATLSSTSLIPVAGIMLIFGVDRFLSTARGLISLCGQTVASIVVSTWEGEFDRERATAVLNGREPAPAPEEQPPVRSQVDTPSHP
jgi:aerobic C4-dicarboxylate transport protein